MKRSLSLWEVIKKIIGFKFYGKMGRSIFQWPVLILNDHYVSFCDLDCSPLILCNLEGSSEILLCWVIYLFVLTRYKHKDRHSPWYTTRKSHFPPWNFATFIGFSLFFQLMGIHTLTFTTSQCDLRPSIPHWLMWAIGLRYKVENWHVTQTRFY